MASDPPPNVPRTLAPWASCSSRPSGEIAQPEGREEREAEQSGSFNTLPDTRRVKPLTDEVLGLGLRHSDQTPDFS